MNTESYQRLAATLSTAVTAAMWSTESTEQVEALLALQDVLESQARGLPLHEPARLRLEILQVLKRADEYEDDARAKEFGALYVMLETMTTEDRAAFATLLVQLLRIAAKASEPHP